MSMMPYRIWQPLQRSSPLSFLPHAVPLALLGAWPFYVFLERLLRMDSQLLAI